MVGTTWSNGTPTANQNIEFKGAYAVATDLTAFTFAATLGDLKIPTGTNLILRGKLTVNSLGTLTFQNNASLIQTDTYIGTKTGNIIYKGINTAMSKLDYC